MKRTRRSLVYPMLLSCLAAPIEARADPSPCIDSADAALEAALGQADLDTGQDARWRTRLRWAAVVPRISAALNRTDGYGEYYGFRAEGPDNLNMNARSLSGWSVRATWDLGSLFYDGREMQLESARQRRWRERRELADIVLSLYAQRQNALRQPAATSQDFAGTRDRRLAVQLIETKLHLLTGGVLCPIVPPP